MIVDPIFVTSGRPGRLNPTDQVVLRQHMQGVVDGLTGDGTDLRANLLTDLVCHGVRRGLHRPVDGKPLCRHMKPRLPQRFRNISLMRLCM